MTIYSIHPSRGKTQILATYRTPDDVTTSTTVTSLDDPAVANAIADALSRISACATLPLCAYDERGERLGHYPNEHLATLTDPATRDGLLTGAHSLWYELVMFELHAAFTDLDRAVVSAPEPVKLAITQELTVEARDLQAEYAHYSRNAKPAVPIQRAWSYDQPFLAYDGGMTALATTTRERLDQLEDDADTDTAVEAAIGGLRVLLAADRDTTNTAAMLDAAALSILDDPSWGSGFYLSIDSPTPSHPRRWSVYLGWWVPDDPDDEDTEDSSGEAVVICDLPAAPTVADLVTLLNLSATGGSQLEAWAKTPVGEPFAGTAFAVTSRDESHF